MTTVTNEQPPTGLKRLLFRLPIHLYRMRLGWLFGDHLLLLHHVGRVTGKRRRVVLEVVEHDAEEGTYAVASGWGRKAAWYRNVLRTPEVTVQVGTRRIPVRAVPVPAQEGAEIFARYAERHRTAARHIVPRLMDFAVDGSESDFRAAGEQIPFIRFVPRR